MSDAADDLVSQASQAERAISSTQTEISRQELDIDQIATAMNEMTTTVAEIARNTTDASNSANTAKIVASEDGGLLWPSVFFRGENSL